MKEFKIDVVEYEGELVFRTEKGFFFRKLEACTHYSFRGGGVILKRSGEVIATAYIGEWGTHGSGPAFLGALAQLMTNGEHFYVWIFEPANFEKGDVLILKTSQDVDLEKALRDHERFKGESHKGEIVIS